MALNGNNIFITIGEGSAAVIIAGTRTNEIQVESEMIEISSPNSGKWREYIAGRSEWSFTTGFLVLANENVADLLETGTKVGVHIVGRQGTSTVELLHGEAWIKTGKMTFSRSNLAQGSFAFQGTGELSSSAVEIDNGGSLE